MRPRNFKWARILLGTMLCGSSLAFAADDTPRLTRAELTRQMPIAAPAAIDAAGQGKGYHDSAGAVGRIDARPTYYGQGYESRMGDSGRGSSQGYGRRH